MMMSLCDIPSDQSVPAPRHWGTHGTRITQHHDIGYVSLRLALCLLSL
jgi:hypothetical protein